LNYTNFEFILLPKEVKVFFWALFKTILKVFNPTSQKGNAGLPLFKTIGNYRVTRLFWRIR